MIAVDTNVLVRLLVGDHPEQAKACQQLFARHNVFISDSVLLETEWVLRAAYDLPPVEVCRALRLICGLDRVTLVDAQRMARAIDWHAAGLDFADAVHLATSPGQTIFKTFDPACIRRAGKITGRRVEKP